MKESNFYSDEFEQLIREKTEQYKMYPSENVWKGVHSSLHTKRKWFIGSMAVLVTGILFFSGKELLAPSHPSTHKLAAIGLAPADSFNTDPARSSQTEDNPHANFVRLRPTNTTTISGRPLNHLTITINHPVVSQPDLTELANHAVRLPGEAPSLIEANGTPADAIALAQEHPATEPGLLDSWLVHSSGENATVHKNTDAQGGRNNAETLREPAEASRETAEAMVSKESGHDLDDDDAVVRGVIENLSARGQQRIHTGQISRNPLTHQGSVAGKIKDSAGAAMASADAIGEAADLVRVTWLHDYAEYSLPPNPSRGHLFFQLFLAPTVNYRDVSGGTMPSPEKFTGPGQYHSGDPLSFVHQRPTLGFEFGANVLYRLTRNLTVKGGLQFNYSRFKMLAYSSLQQQQQQTGSYQSPLGNRIYNDSMAQAAAATANNPFVAYNPSILYDDYYQLSAPIGFELRVLGNERLQLNLGATIQPGYLFNTNNSYVLSGDYTTYSKQPGDFHRWNLSGGVEAFLSYQTGPIRWQVGPEFHYQLFANYLSGSPTPVSENLRGYGIKIGITKPLP